MNANSQNKDKIDLYADISSVKIGYLFTVNKN